MTKLSRDGESLDGVEVMRGPRAGRNAQYAYVECTDCKEISRCTPFNDFYQKGGDPESHVCEKCMCAHHNIKPENRMMVIVPSGTELKPGDRIVPIEVDE